MSNDKPKKERAISLLKAKVRLANYNLVTPDGLFDPICPAGYNFLTGYCEWKGEFNMNLRLTAPSSPGKLNGSATYNP